MSTSSGEVGSEGKRSALKIELTRPYRRQLARLWYGNSAKFQQVPKVLELPHLSGSHGRYRPQIHALARVKQMKQPYCSLNMTQYIYLYFFFRRLNPPPARKMPELQEKVAKEVMQVEVFPLDANAFCEHLHSSITRRLYHNRMEKPLNTWTLYEMLGHGVAGVAVLMGPTRSQTHAVKFIDIHPRKMTWNSFEVESAISVKLGNLHIGPVVQAQIPLRGGFSAIVTSRLDITLLEAWRRLHHIPNRTRRDDMFKQSILAVYAIMLQLEDRKITHGDMHSQNIMLTPNNHHLRLIDFGRSYIGTAYSQLDAIIFLRGMYVIQKREPGFIPSRWIAYTRSVFNKFMNKPLPKSMEALDNRLYQEWTSLRYHEQVEAQTVASVTKAFRVSKLRRDS